MFYRASNQYAMWHEFRRDLGKYFGEGLLNRRWLEVRPKAPLSWNKSQMQATLSELERL